ncbi:MAG: acyltransferase [Ruminococcus sp.]|nr:acyltransferase [Ruminococcus sp.]
MNKRINSIDIIRFFAAFFVVMLHLGNNFYNPYICPIGRAAVPCFFIISGFFYYQSKHKLRAIKRIFLITILSNLLYFMFYAFEYSKGIGVGQYIVQIVNYNSIFNAFVFNRSLVSVHLWYLSALLYCMIIQYAINEIFKVNINTKICVLIIVLLLSIGLILGPYAKIVFGKSILITYTRNVWFIGLPYFLIGKLIVTNKIPKLSNKLLVSIIFIFSVFVVIERNLLVNSSLINNEENFIGISFLAVSIVLLAINNPIYEPNKFLKCIAYCGKNYSLSIYIVQMMVIEILELLVEKLGLQMPSWYSYIQVFVVFGISLLISVFYYKTKNSIQNKFMSKK